MAGGKWFDEIVFRRRGACVHPQPQASVPVTGGFKIEKPRNADGAFMPCANDF